MFVRTKVFRNRDGSTRIYLQLVSNERVDDIAGIRTREWSEEEMRTDVREFLDTLKNLNVVEELGGSSR